jgi:hypothetical protein
MAAPIRGGGAATDPRAHSAASQCIHTAALENIECPYSTRDLSANLNKLTAEKRAAQVAELEKVLSA